MAEISARVHVLLARDTPMGLVIRRGPSKSVATILWNRDTDDFQVGQWLKGRIYERRSDLSPDGRYFIYFAMSGKWSTECEGSWTAVSRSPYLKAIAMFPKGDCWNGGGLWIDRNAYWLNGGGSVLLDTAEVYRVESKPFGGVGSECLSVYYPRLIRDGWKLTDSLGYSEAGRVDVFEKQFDRDWVLCKIAHAQTGSLEGKGCYWDEHRIVNTNLGIQLDYPDWEWAEIDRQRLVWATGGKLHSGIMGSRGLVCETELYDFNPVKFRPIKAPY